MLDWLKKYKIQIICGVIVFLLLIPLMINALFVIGDMYPLVRMKWDAGDVLSFYGTILATAGAICGVYFSIQQAQKNYREDIKNQVLPYIAITQLKGKTTYNAFMDSHVKEEKSIGDGLDYLPVPEYEERKLSSIYFIIDQAKIVNYLEMPPKYRQLLLQAGTEWVQAAQGLSLLTRAPYISMPLEIENIGKGPALYLRIGFYRTDDTPRYLPPIILKAGQTFYIHVFSACPKENLSKEYSLDFVYQDIYRHKYSQTFVFSIGEDSCTLDLNVEQREFQ